MRAQNIAHMTGHRPAALLLCVLSALAAACTSAPANTTVPSLPTAPTARPAASPAATHSPSPTPTASLAATPSRSPTPTAEPSPSPTAEPLDPVEYLIRLARAELQPTCAARDQIYDAEIVSVTCGPDDLPFDYSLFEALDEMNAAFADDLAGAETPPDPESTSCSTGRHLTDYSLGDGESFGRLNCREHTSTSGALYHVLEWTNEEFLVIGYISNLAEAHTWDELFDFWTERAGPLAD